MATIFAIESQDPGFCVPKVPEYLPTYLPSYQGQIAIRDDGRLRERAERVEA